MVMEMEYRRLPAGLRPMFCTPRAYVPASLVLPPPLSSQIWSISQGGLSPCPHDLPRLSLDCAQIRYRSQAWQYRPGHWFVVEEKECGMGARPGLEALDTRPSRATIPRVVAHKKAKARCDVVVLIEGCGEE